MSPAIKRCAIYGPVLALACIGVWIAEQPQDRSAAARARTQATPDRAVNASTPATAPAQRVPELQLERLPQRSAREAPADLFNARSWDALTAEEASRNAPPPPRPPPQAPPLPFKFLGKLIDGNRVTVFLTDGERNWLVQVGDTIDGAYRAETVGDRTMTLTYLALELPQELSIGEAASSLAMADAAPLRQSAGTVASSTPLPAPAPIQPRTTAVPTSQVPLLLAAPLRVTTGNELTVSLGLPPGSSARDARVELAFDPKVLFAIGGPSPGNGRVTIDLSSAAAPLAQVRFRVIAQSPTTTRIGIEQATATDARGARLSIASPGAHSVEIVQTGG